MKIRNQGRGIVVNAKGEILFVKHRDEVPASPGEPDRLEYWVPPGGGVDVDETFEEAAVREVLEETGIVIDEVVRFMHTVEKPLRFGNEMRLMHAQYFLMRIHHDGAAASVRDPGEGIIDVRWWSDEEMARSGEVFRPLGIEAMCVDALVELGFVRRGLSYTEGKQ